MLGGNCSPCCGSCQCPDFASVLSDWDANGTHVGAVQWSINAWFIDLGEIIVPTQTATRTLWDYDADLAGTYASGGKSVSFKFKTTSSATRQDWSATYRVDFGNGIVSTYVTRYRCASCTTRLSGAGRINGQGFDGNDCCCVTYGPARSTITGCLTPTGCDAVTNPELNPTPPYIAYLCPQLPSENPGFPNTIWSYYTRYNFFNVLQEEAKPYITLNDWRLHRVNPLP